MFIKCIKDNVIKLIFGKSTHPAGLYESSEYFRHNGPIRFEIVKEGSALIAKSTNFRCGSIITYGKTSEELDRNIKDAILTTFEIPSSYARLTDVQKVNSKDNQYQYAPA